MQHRNKALFFAAILLFAIPRIEASSPSLNEIVPRGAQRGVETEVSFIGDRLEDAQEILFTKTGIEVTKLEFVAPNTVKATLKIAPDAPLGTRAAYIRTATGISSLRNFSVGALKQIDEPEPNGEKAAAPKVELNTTINGIVQGEDVDYFAVDAKEGDRLNFQVEGISLAGSDLDPALTLYGPDGIEVAAADDTPLLGQECALTFVAAKPGLHTISVREASYGGGGNFYYRLHLGTFPRPYGVFPAGGKPGEKLRVKWLGDPKLGEADIELPQTLGNVGVLPEAEGLVAPTMNHVRVSNLDAINEVEPNNELAAGSPAVVPGAWNGIIETEGDTDWFVFEAKKGQVFDFNCYGRRLRSPIDSVMGLNKMDGAGIVGDDDAAAPDSYFRATIPDDGKYAVYVKDHLGKGGPLYYYRVEATVVEPGLDLVLYVPGREFTPMLSVPAANRNAFMLSVRRKDLGGAMKFVADRLPPGVKAEIMDCPDGIGDIPVLLSADEGTTPAGAFIDLVGRPVDENVKVAGHINQRIDLIRIQDGSNRPMMQHEMKEIPFAVTAKAPYTIEIVEPKVPIVRGGNMGLLVKATRAEGYAEPINLRLLWNPPGVGSGTVQIPGDKTEAVIPVDANGGAGLGDWKICAIGGATVGNAGIEVSSQLAKLTISEPWLGIQFAKARTDQGTTTTIAVNLAANHEFQGEATLELLGLPHNVTTEPQKITKDTKEVKYIVKVAADSPPGQHTSLFARAVITDQGEPITQNTGGAELRIDKPLPPPAPPPPPAAGQTPAPTPKAEGPVRGERKPAKGIAPFKRNG